MLLLICQQLKPSGFDCAPSILCRVTLSTLRLTYLRVAPWVSSPCHLLPLGEGSAMMAYCQAYQLALVSEPHDQEGLTWKGLIRSTGKMEGKRGSCSIPQSSSPVSGDAWTSRHKSQISAPCRTQCLSYEYMPDLHGKSLKLSQNWKAGYVWFQLDSCLLAIHKANWRASNCCLGIQAIVFEFYWIPNDVPSLTSVSFDK